MKKWLVYDERARYKDTFDCSVMLVADTKEEALKYAKDYNGVVEENTIKGNDLINGKIIN